MFDIDAAFRRIEEKQNQVDNQKALDVYKRQVPDCY